MAKKRDLPGFYKKRKTLFGEKTPPQKLLQMGKQFMDAGRYDDALEFFERADADEFARQIAALAMEAGNTPMYMRAKKVLGEEITEQEWSQLAASAEKAGLYSAAYVGYVKAGDEDEAVRVQRLMETLAGQEPEVSEQSPEQDAAGADRTSRSPTGRNGPKKG